MTITGKIYSKVYSERRDLPDAQLRIWALKRSDGAEVLVFDGKSTDDGSFRFGQHDINGVPFTPQQFSRLKYSVAKKDYRKAEGIKDMVDGDINLGDIELEREALRVHGRVSSNKRPVYGAKVILLINGVERACIPASHEGTFDREIDGIYEGQTLDWTVKRFGYISRKGRVEIRSNMINLETIDVTPGLLIGICQLLGIAPEVLAGVLITSALGAVVVWWALGCPEASVKAEHFTKGMASGDDVQKEFERCRFAWKDKCGKEKDDGIVQCMTEKRGYQFSR